MTENRFQGQYKKVGSSKVSEQDKRLLHQSNSEIKVYLTGGKAAPEGREIREGSGGGGSGGGGGDDEEQEHSAPDAPQIEGAQKTVRVTGDGIGVIAGIVSGKLVVKSIKNKETVNFIRKVVACSGGDDAGKFISCMKKIAEEMDLEVST